MRNSNWNYGRTIVVVPDVDCVIYCLSRVTVFFTRRNRVLSRVTAPSFLFDYGGVRRPTEDGRRTHPSYFGTLSISDCSQSCGSKNSSIRFDTHRKSSTKTNDDEKNELKNRISLFSNDNWNNKQ